MPLRLKKTAGFFVVLSYLVFYEQHSGDFHEFRTRRHFTLFTIYLTPEHGTFRVVFNVLLQW